MSHNPPTIVSATTREGLRVGVRAAPKSVLQPTRFAFPLPEPRPYDGPCRKYTSLPSGRHPNPSRKPSCLQEPERTCGVFEEFAGPLATLSLPPVRWPSTVELLCPDVGSCSPRFVNRRSRIVCSNTGTSWHTHPVRRRGPHSIDSPILRDQARVHPLTDFRSRLVSAHLLPTSVDFWSDEVIDEKANADECPPAGGEPHRHS